MYEAGRRSVVGREGGIFEAGRRSVVGRKGG